MKYKIEWVEINDNEIVEKFEIVENIERAIGLCDELDIGYGNIEVLNESHEIIDTLIDWIVGVLNDEEEFVSFIDNTLTQEQKEYLVKNYLLDLEG